MNLSEARQAAAAKGYAAVLTYGGPVQLRDWLKQAEPRDAHHYDMKLCQWPNGRHYLTDTKDPPPGFYRSVWPLVDMAEFVAFASKPSDSEAAMARQAGEG